MNILNSLIKGLAWGFGFTIALLSSIWIFETYIGFAPRQVEYSWPNSKNDPESLDEDEIKNIDINIDQIDMAEGKVIVAGNVINNNDREIFWLKIDFNVFEEDRLIERCEADNDFRVAAKENAEFYVFCASKWNEIELEDIRVKAIPKGASAYK